MPAAFERNRTNIRQLWDNFSRLYRAAAKTMLEKEWNAVPAMIGHGKSHPVMMKTCHRHNQ
jgi:hypothetical protein